MKGSSFPLYFLDRIPFSFNYNRQEVMMKWAPIDEPVQKLAEIVLPDFDLFMIKSKAMQEVRNSFLFLLSAYFQPYPAGMWDELHVVLLFERRFIWYFMQAYLPTYLTIFIRYCHSNRVY